MTFDYEFFKDILLILIPLIGGTLTAKWISQSWQERKEKNEIKRMILSQFSGSFGRKYSLLGEVFGRLYNHYIDLGNIKQNPDGTLSYQAKFPINDSEKPFNKYSNEWEEFEKS